MQLTRVASALCAAVLLCQGAHAQTTLELPARGDGWFRDYAAYTPSPYDEPGFGALPATERFALAAALESEAGGGAGAASEDSAAAIAEAMLNPLSYLWLMFAQNDVIVYDGDVLSALDEDERVQNSLLLMPVFSQQLTENWKMIFRPVIPLNSFESADGLNVSVDNTPDRPTFGIDVERDTGLGDIVLWTAFSRQYTAPHIFGFGSTIMLDTADEPRLGTGKTSAGPMALYFNITDKWVRGAIAQHWWSFDGGDFDTVDTRFGPVQVERPDVNLTDLQVVLRYRYSALTNIGMAPNWRYNWETDQLSLPLGIGFDTLVYLGKLPTKVGVEAYYYVEKNDEFGPDWQLRFLFVPVLPAPASSREPWFGR